MNVIVRLLIVALPIALIGCTTIGSKILPSTDSKYLNSTSIPPLRMPPGVSSSAFSNDFPVSYRNYPRSSENPGVVPPGLYK